MTQRSLFEAGGIVPAVDSKFPSIACVSVPALPLQWVLRAQPEWRNEPVVVVEDDRPLAPILWANRPARAVHITHGMSFTQARALHSKLRAEVVPESRIEAAVEALFERLIDFSPYVEPLVEQPGVFFIDPRGLCALFGSLQAWAQQVQEALDEQGYVASVAVGFARPRIFALACARHAVTVLADATEERVRSDRVPLARLGVAQKLIEAMALLDVRTVGEFIALPVGQLRVRYGAEAARLHDFLSGRTWSPLLPKTPIEPLTLELEVDPPDDDHTRLLFGIRRVLQSVTVQLAAAHEGICALSLQLMMERLGEHRERVETAVPTLDVVQIVDLLRLRLNGVALPARVELVRITLERARVHPRQLSLDQPKAPRFPPSPPSDHPSKTSERPRDLEAAARALARLKASFGPQAVLRARLHDAHLPEARYRLEPVSEVRYPRAMDPPALLPLVRRVFRKPRSLAHMPAHEPESWLGKSGAVRAIYGPDRIAGGWWTRRRERDYYYVETKQGAILWIYYDRSSRRYRLHGIVD